MKHGKTKRGKMKCSKIKRDKTKPATERAGKTYPPFKTNGPGTIIHAGCSGGGGRGRWSQKIVYQAEGRSQE